MTSAEKTKLRFYNNAYLDDMRLEGDPVADNLIKRTFESGDGPTLKAIMRTLSSNQALHNPDLPEELKNFYHAHAQLPQWADKGLMLRGSQFFCDHAQAIMSMLGTLSLPYCYAGADGAQVLYMSKRIYQDTSRRLLETGQFVLDVSEPHTFAGGNGFTSALNVRLMHAAIRHHIIHTDHWNSSWGFPINQEDMAGTIEAFSFVCIRGLRKAGFIVSYEDAHAFQHLWNVVGWLMGVRYELLPDSGLEAIRLDECIRDRQFKKSEAGQVLTNALLKTMAQAKADTLPADFLPAYSRFLLGEDIADMLDIPKAKKSSKIPINLMQWKNSIVSLFPRQNENEISAIRRQLRDGQINNLVRFSIPLSL